MPRKRIIDPEFWSDEEIAEHWPFEARLFYIGLWNFADDVGRIKANPKLLKAQIFPYDVKITVKKVENLKKITSNKVFWYKINGQDYGWVKNFLKHQRIDRPGESQIPPPPEELLKKFVERSANDRRTIPPNIIEVNRIEYKYTVQIIDHWNSKKIKILEDRETQARKKTLQKIKKRLKDYSIQEILGAIDNYSTVQKGEQFFFSYRWQLWEFLERGLVNFLSKSNPFDSYLKDGYRISQVGKAEGLTKFDRIWSSVAHYLYHQGKHANYVLKFRQSATSVFPKIEQKWDKSDKKPETFIELVEQAKES